MGTLMRIEICWRFNLEITTGGGNRGLDALIFPISRQSPWYGGQLGPQNHHAMLLFLPLQKYFLAITSCER